MFMLKPSHAMSVYFCICSSFVNKTWVLTTLDSEDFHYNINLKFKLKCPFNACIPIHFLVAGLQEATIAVTEKSVKEVMTLDDETFDKFYRHTEDIAKITSRVEINDDFDAIFGMELPR